MFNLMGLDWQGGVVLDLFAGSGALGIEAMSRGADGAVFVDTDPRSLAAIRQNLERCQRGDAAVTDACKVWRMDWRQAPAKVMDVHPVVSWVFLDPPYALNLWEAAVEQIISQGITVAHGVVCEHPAQVELPEQLGGFGVWKHKQYGDISVTIYRT